MPCYREALLGAFTYCRPHFITGWQILSHLGNGRVQALCFLSQLTYGNGKALFSLTGPLSLNCFLAFLNKYNNIQHSLTLGAACPPRDTWPPACLWRGGRWSWHWKAGDWHLLRLSGFINRAIGESHLYGTFLKNACPDFLGAMGDVSWGVFLV